MSIWDSIWQLKTSRQRRRTKKYTNEIPEYIMNVLGLTGMVCPEIADRNGRNLYSKFMAKFDFLRVVSVNLNIPKIPKSGSFARKLLDNEQSKEIFWLMQDEKLKQRAV